MTKTLNQWWSSAVFYQIYPRSFADANGDGIGDIQGIIEHLGYLELLGVDSLWISPITESPMADHGYDVSNPRLVDPTFGSLEDFDELIEIAHYHGIRVIMDLVPNHTSDQHEWFKQALTSAPGSLERERYIFRNGKGKKGELPPNNWQSVFGGSAWTRIKDTNGKLGQWYLHLFAPEQPDLNWTNPEIWSDLEETLYFWLNRGIDGFRIDVAHGLAKPEGLPDMDISKVELLVNSDTDIRFNNPAVHNIHRKIRSVLNSYPEKVAVGEIWVRDNKNFADYIRPDELHLAFNFRLTEANFNINEIREAIINSIESAKLVNGVPTWALSNHDVHREVSRYALPDNPQIGLDRARAMALVVMALPGTVFLYQGEELGLPNAFVPEELRQDPVWKRSKHTEEGRDNVRVPLPWEGEIPPFGFSANSFTWLPIPETWKQYTVESQLEDSYSTLSLYRATIEMRKYFNEGIGIDVEWFDAPDGCLAFRRKGGSIICAFNANPHPVALPPGQIILSSAPLEKNTLPAYSSVWVKSGSFPESA